MLTPLKTFCENMLPHVHKVIHLVVDTLEQGLETLSAECPPVECEQTDGANGALYRKDRVSQSAPDAGHTVIGHWGPASGQWREVKAALGLLTRHRRPDSG